ncbi:hypothetical protein Q7A53_21700 [Halobacillus rhizosphaerae]|uniref:hypothetical protein n=1 Tax=Halobacillus rhizosphaerae TaxID=3064889 RepID=UPI00398B1A67
MERRNKLLAKRNFIPIMLSAIVYAFIEDNIRAVVEPYVHAAFAIHVVMILIHTVFLLLPWYIVRKIVDSYLQEQ